MKLITLILLLLCSVTSASHRYVFMGTRESPRKDWDPPSCQAVGRLLEDTFTVSVYEDGSTARVNHMDWEVDPAPWNRWPGDLRLIYGKPGAYTFLVMDIQTDDRAGLGTLILWGRLPDRRVCADEVELVGYRL